MKILKNILKYSLLFCSLSFLSILISDEIVKSSTQNLVYTSVENTPYNKVGLLLGTAKTLRNGRLNLYYKYRIDAAVELYNAKKIDYILVSGDNSKKDYDEPSLMKVDLIKRGVGEDKIFLDYAGFRTLDSMVRSKEIFGQSEITVISQKFHNERAVYIAKKKGLAAVGFNARDVSKRYGIKVQLREKFARVKMLLDLISGKGPKFLGDKINIE